MDHHVAPTLKELHEAAARIEPHAHRTPVMTCGTLDRLAGRRLFFKCENLQKCGAFKFRGALNAVLALSPEDAERGVVTDSSGNHGQALAAAARIRGIPAHIVMPSDAPMVKQKAVAGNGARPSPNARKQKELMKPGARPCLSSSISFTWPLYHKRLNYSLRKGSKHYLTR